METPHHARTGGQILIDALRINGVQRVFCVPGESYLAALDALHDARNTIDLIVCRQEGGAAYMAEAHGKLTGEPGICFVTRGPGATNAAIGVHTAFQDSTPMILLIGQVAREQMEREAFQEIDYRRMYGPMAKWVVQIEDAGRIPELMSQAFHRALNGRPGPVVVVLPEDVLSDSATLPDAPRSQRVEMHAGAEQLAQMQALLEKAERPLMILGGGGWNAEAVADIHAFSEASGVPVAASFRAQDLFDNAHAQYAGELGTSASPALQARIRASDLLLVVGARLGEMTTGSYTLIDIPVPRQTLIHVHPGAEELGRVYAGSLLINASMAAFARQAAALPALSAPRWAAWTRDANAEYRDNLKPVATPGAVQMGEIMEYLREVLAHDAILTMGAGNYTGWPMRFHQYRRFRSQLGPTNGSMGYGVPAAIAAKLARPQTEVIAFAGDGCFMMNGQELASAIQYDARIIVLVINNGMFGTIRMHQEREYPARVCGTALVNPDFARLARAYGAHGECVEKTEQFAPAFERARASGKPALIEIRLDPEVISTRTSLSAVRAKALERR